MTKIPYTSAICSLIYAMVHTVSYFAHMVGAVKHYMSKLRKEHCVIIKWILYYLKGLKVDLKL